MGEGGKPTGSTVPTAPVQEHMVYHPCTHTGQLHACQVQPTWVVHQPLQRTWESTQPRARQAHTHRVRGGAGDYGARGAGGDGGQPSLTPPQPATATHTNTHTHSHIHQIVPPLHTLTHIHTPPCTQGRSWAGPSAWEGCWGGQAPQQSCTTSAMVPKKQGCMWAVEPPLYLPHAEPNTPNTKHGGSPQGQTTCWRLP